MATYYVDAFQDSLDEVKEPERWYVCLIRTCQAFGGPEEGGWWYDVGECLSYRAYGSEEDAEAAKARVEALAAEYSKQALREYGDKCLRETEWLDERGLEDSFLPEPDGPDKYSVIVCKEIPTWDNRKPQYC